MQCYDLWENRMIQFTKLLITQRFASRGRKIPVALEMNIAGKTTTPAMFRGMQQFSTRVEQVAELSSN